MPVLRCAFLALAVCLAGAAPCRAGLYNTAEPELETRAAAARQINTFRESLSRLRGLAADKVDFDYPLRKRYALQADLAGRAAVDRLSLEEKLNLSDVLVRRGRAGEALQLLTPLAQEHPDNPLVAANLATATHLFGEVGRASEMMSAMVAESSKVWPPSWHDLSEKQQKFLQAIGIVENYEQYRKAEKLYAKLLRLRFRESKLNPKGVDEVDALFDDGKGPKNAVRFVDDAGGFTPGKVAAGERAKLPRDAIDQVQQLLIWLPNDYRLYRLLGELYNAQGSPDDVRAAAVIFEDLVTRLRYTPGDVAARQAKLAAEVSILPDPSEIDPVTINKKLDDTTPPFDWRSLLVAFGFGFVVALFAGWQVREIRRRRQVRPPAA